MVILGRTPCITLVACLMKLIPSAQGFDVLTTGTQWTAPLADAINKAQLEFLDSLLLPPCTQVNSSWAALEAAVQTSNETLALCPFQIVKPPEANLVLDKKLYIYCVRPRPTDQCILTGGGNHIRIQGSAADVVVEGVLFENATNCAVRVAPSAQKNQLLHDCEFFRNLAPSSGWRGAAIKTEKGTSLTVSSCSFVGNEAIQGAGGAIYSRGDLTIKDSTFSGNTARQGGAVSVETSRAFLSVRNSIFSNNVATKDAGGAIVVSGPTNWTTDLMTGGSSNTPCSGVYDDLTNTCTEFSPVFEPTPDPEPFAPGNLTVRQEGLRLSSGLSVKVLARSGHRIEYTSNEAIQSISTLPFHLEPDGAAVFELEDGGWVYISNSEVRAGSGGVYALEFDAQGLIRNYEERLTGTSRNCNGGVTPWNTWVSCEEEKSRAGQCWQVDPVGERQAMQTKLVEPAGGHFEAMAYDIHNADEPQFFVTEDQEFGALRRFRPNATNLTWDMLHGEGKIDYLQLFPDNGTFTWTPSLETGRQSAFDYFQFTEGIINGDDGVLLFVAKQAKQLFRLDLDNLTYTVSSTRVGALSGGGNFAAGPDQLVEHSDMIYFTEDGGNTPGLYVHDGTRYYALLEAYDERFRNDETTGAAFSPDGTKLYVCLQEAGYLFQVERDDGLPFDDGGRRLMGLKL